MLRGVLFVVCCGVGCVCGVVGGSEWVDERGKGAVVLLLCMCVFVMCQQKPAPPTPQKHAPIVPPRPRRVDKQELVREGHAGAAKVVLDGGEGVVGAGAVGQHEVELHCVCGRLCVCARKHE